MESPGEQDFANVKTQFLSAYKTQHGIDLPATYEFHTSNGAPVAEGCLLGLWDDHSDFFLEELILCDDPAESSQTPQTALQANQAEKGEISYYYAHTSGPRIPAEPPEMIHRANAAPKAANAKISPFGTDVARYHTITSYSFEDAKEWVKVLVPMEGIGAEGADNISCNFGERAFELLVENWRGKKWRFGSAKLHSTIESDRSKFKLMPNRVTVYLRKAKTDDIWYDLIKKKAIGDNDDP